MPASIDTVQGRRTGRPRGAKGRQTSQVRRDILWAYRNLAGPFEGTPAEVKKQIQEAEKALPKAPSAGALRWWRIGMTEHEAFVGKVFKVDAAQIAAKRADEGEREEEGDDKRLLVTGLVDRLIEEYERGACQ